MRYDVKYVAAFSFGKKLMFMGEGTVHVLETGLILEGELPQFHLPLIFWEYHRLLATETSRTIPYSMIQDYTPPSALSSTHRIRVRFLTARAGHYERRLAAFKVLRGPSDFSARLREYITVARQVSAGGGWWEQ